MKQALKHQPKAHELPIRVYYEDTDAGGVVYHASYLRYAERGRTEMLRDIGFEHAALAKETGVIFAVRHMTIDYTAPARLDDLLTLKTHVAEMKGSSVKMVQEFWRGDQKLAGIEVVLVAIDKNIKATRLPEALREKFKD